MTATCNPLVAVHRMRHLGPKLKLCSHDRGPPLANPIPCLDQHLESFLHDHSLTYTRPNEGVMGEQAVTNDFKNTRQNQHKAKDFECRISSSNS